MKYRKQAVSFFAIIFITALLTNVLLLYVHTSTGKKLPITNGAVDISGWSSRNDKVLSLGGDWEFYWNRLITYQDLRSGVKPDLIQNVPQVWNRYRIKGENLPGFGFGTYRLKITGAQNGKPLALWIPTFSTAYRLYVDDDLIASGGTVSNIPEIGKPQFLPRQVVFTPRRDTFDLIIQVSNYTYSRGGMWYTLYLGDPGRVFGIERGILCRDLFILGSLCVMAFIYFSIFMFRRQEKSNLYFAVLCFISACRTLLHGSYLFNTILSFLPFKYIIGMDYLVLYWFPVILTALLRQLFPCEFTEKPIKVVLYGYAAFMSALTLLTPVSFFTNFVYLAEFVFLLISIYIFIKMCRAIWHDRAHAALLLTGCIILLLGAAFDVMYQNSVITAGFFELTPICFFLLLLMQAHVLAESFALTIQKKDEALAQLQISSERERQTELKFLKSQIRPHFIHNALNTILSVSRKDVPRAQELLMEFSSYLRGCFDFKDLNDVIPIESELEFVRSYIILEQARFGEKLQVEYDIDDESIMVPPLILQPLVENAVVHGIRPKPDGGKILIYVKRSGETTRIGVTDNGDGIDPEKADRLIAGEDTGRSVGIFNITKRLKKLYGISLCIKNMEGGGLDVYMELPRIGGNG
ncbi:MAG TPA: histidine kinase [Caproiciproducens sp.]|nr:histidine kinase [Caproiciproducens sp.]